MTIFLFFFIPFLLLLGRSIYRVHKRLREEAADAIKKAEYAAWMEEQRELRRRQMFISVGLDPDKSDRELDVPNQLFMDPRPKPAIPKRRKSTVAKLC